MLHQAREDGQALQLRDVLRALEGREVLALERPHLRQDPRGFRPMSEECVPCLGKCPPLVRLSEDVCTKSVLVEGPSSNPIMETFFLFFLFN